MTMQRHSGQGAELELFSSNSARGALAELLPEFERTTGLHVTVSYDPALIMLKRIRAGETADLAILGEAAIDSLIAEGTIRRESRRTLARCRVGIAVAAGAAKPDVSSVDAFKHALLACKSVCHTTSGASGMHFSRIVERLDIADAIRAKAVTNEGGLIGELVARGEAEVAIQQIPELMAVPGIELVGPLPEALQSVSVTTAGIFSASQRAAEAQALIDFLSAPASVAVFRAKGFEPV
jgi:molybdate transport system substrate-binding protein